MEARLTGRIDDALRRQLQETCGALAKCLDAVEPALKKRIDTAGREHSTLLARLADIRRKQSKIQAALSERENERSSLDQEVLEKLGKDHVDGDMRIDYAREGWLKLPPTLTFSLKTTTPIRGKAELSQSPGLKWKDLDYSVGGKTFRGSVKLRAFSDAFAEVALYGWKREVHAGKIAGLVGEIAILQSNAKYLVASEKMASAAISAVKEMLDGYAAQLAACRRDKSSLKQLSSEHFARVRPYLVIDSISGVAKALGLRSSIQASSAGLGPGDYVDALTQTVIYALMEDFVTAKETLAQHCTSSAQLRSEYSNLVRQLESKLPENKHGMSTMPLGNIYSSSGAHMLRDEAIADLNDLQAGYDLLVSEAGLNHNEAVEGFPGDGRSSRHKALTERDAAALLRSAEMISKDELEIGVMAAVQSSTSPVEAWLSIYRGVSLELELGKD